MTLTQSLIQDTSRFEQTQLNIEKDNWNWCDPSRYDGARPAYYYEASLTPWQNGAPLARDAACDVLVIGGGLLGASAALHLAEAGVDTILVDKHHIGSAASGRNGGQLTPGLARWEAADMIEHLSHDDAKRLWRFASAESMDLIDAIGARYALDLDRKRGHITATVHPGHTSALLDGADARRSLGDPSVTLVGKHQLQEYVRSGLYHGAAIDAMGGQIHPLALVRGNRLLFGGQGTGTCWAQPDVNAYLLDRLNTVFPQYGQFALDYCWSGVSDFTLNGATDSRKAEGNVPVYMVQGWSGHGVAQTVRIGKAICGDFVGRNDDFSMLTGIDHREIPLGRQLSPIAIPAAKAAMSVMNAINPGKMISF